MSVLKKFFEMALLLTFITFCINGTLFFFGEAFVPEPTIPIATLTGDINSIFVDGDTNGSYILQASTLGTAPTNFSYVGNAVATLTAGFPLKIIAILSEYGLGHIGLFIAGIFGIIQIIGLIYLALAAIGTPLGGSVP